MALDTAVDAAQAVRGMLAEIRGHLRKRGDLERAKDSVPCTAVADARDTHDEVSSGTTTFGAMKSMAYTVAWLRQQFRRGGATLRWTATESMIADAMAKRTADGGEHLRHALQQGEWRVQYDQQLARTRRAAARACRCVGKSG